MKRCLIGFVGLPEGGGGAFARTTYVGGTGREITTSFSTVAVGWDLATDDPPWSADELLVVSTEREHEASAVWLPRALEVANLRCRPTPVTIDVGRSRDEIDATAARIRDCVPPGAEVVLDITHAYRRLPMIAMASLSVLRVTRGVRVRHVRYAAMMAPDARGRAPILDLTWTVEAAEMAFAARSLLEQGSGEALAAHLRSMDDARGPSRVRFRPVADALARQLALLGYGLSLDAMAEPSVRINDEQRTTLNERSPLLAPLLEEATRRLEAVASVGDAWPRTGGKAGLALSDDVLAQEARVVEWLLASGRVPAALTLIREWVVDRVLLARGVTEPGKWLRRDVREPHGDAAVGAFVRTQRGRSGATSPLSAPLSWLAQRRNALDHAGHGHDEIRAYSVDEVRPVWQTLQDLSKRLTDQEWRLEPTFPGDPPTEAR